MLSCFLELDLLVVLLVSVPSHIFVIGLAVLEKHFVSETGRDPAPVDGLSHTGTYGSVYPGFCH